MDIDLIVDFIVNEGTNLERGILMTQLDDLIPNAYKKRCIGSRQSYFKEINSLVKDGAVPFGKKFDNPASIFYTAKTLSNLLDMGMTESSLLKRMIEWLKTQQSPDGWWVDNDSVKMIEDLPFWQDPGNGSVKIFNTSMVLSVLARIHNYDIKNQFKRGMNAIEGVTNENGAIFGFPQSSWIITPAITRRYGLKSSRFLLHWTLLDNFVEKTSNIPNIISIARGLTLSDIEPNDPLLKKCNTLISNNLQTQNKYTGWTNSQDELSPSKSLAALLVLKY